MKPRVVAGRLPATPTPEGRAPEPTGKRAAVPRHLGPSPHEAAVTDFEQSLICAAQAFYRFITQTAVIYDPATHAWQAAESQGEWTLVGCTVAPGFDFSGFELARPDFRPGKPFKRT